MLMLGDGARDNLCRTLTIISGEPVFPNLEAVQAAIDKLTMPASGARTAPDELGTRELMTETSEQDALLIEQGDLHNEALLAPQQSRQPASLTRKQEQVPSTANGVLGIKSYSSSLAVSLVNVLMRFSHPTLPRACRVSV